MPSSNPSTEDVVAYLRQAVAVRQGDAPEEVAHVWWMRPPAAIKAQLSAREYVEVFLTTGAGPRSDRLQFTTPDGESISHLSLGLACARFLTGVGPDTEAAEGERAMAFVRAEAKRLGRPEGTRV